MRNIFADTFYELGRVDPRLCIVVADISPAGSIAKFREEFPERFINTGVSEQIMIGIVAGMAQRGMRPFAYTIATFALYRPFEMVRDDLCYQDLPVTVVGIGGGLSYSTLGATHHAQEDITIASAIPNMRVIAPCDPSETEAATRWCATQEEGPVYLRLGKAGEPDLTSSIREPWRFGKMRQVKQGKDVCFLSYGSILKMVLDAALELESEGLSTAVYSVSTLKPLDTEGIVQVLSCFKRVVVVEETAPLGSLGMQVKALAFEAQSECSIESFSLQDEFIHCYGSHSEILKAHGLTSEFIVSKLLSPGPSSP